LRQATIKFTGYLLINQDGEEWCGEDLTDDEACGWVSYCMSRGDKHAWNFTAYGATTTGVTYEDVEDDE
jgi:hypothetical protein